MTFASKLMHAGLIDPSTLLERAQLLNVPVKRAAVVAWTLRGSRGIEAQRCEMNWRRTSTNTCGCSLCTQCPAPLIVTRRLRGNQRSIAAA